MIAASSQEAEMGRCRLQKMAGIFWARRRAAGRGGGRGALPGCPRWGGLPSLGSSLLESYYIYYKYIRYTFSTRGLIYYILLSYSIENRTEGLHLLTSYYIY